MINRPQTRKALLSASLVLTLIAVGWVSRFETSDAAINIDPVAKKASLERKPLVPSSTGVTDHAEINNLPVSTMRYADTVKDIFAPPVLHRPPPAPVEVMAPTAPPLPFTYMGKMEEDGQEYIFLASPSQNYVVHTGDVLNDQYRIDGIENGQVVFTYLPLAVNQTLAIGEVP